MIRILKMLWNKKNLLKKLKGADIHLFLALNINLALIAFVMVLDKEEI